MPAARDEPLNGTDPRKYVQLAARLRGDIGAGMFRQGSPAPSITALSQQYGHARQTCAKALRVLQSEGLLVRVPGLGYFIAEQGETTAPSKT